jgi:hypothetical protein
VIQRLDVLSDKCSRIVRWIVLIGDAIARLRWVNLLLDDTVNRSASSGSVARL